MTENMSDIQTGMDVYGTDGEKIGSVSDVYPNDGSGTGSNFTGSTRSSTGYGTGGTPVSGDVVVEQVDTNATLTPGGYTTGDFTTPAGGATAGAFEPATASAGVGTLTQTGYFKVEHGGILGIGAKDLYFPFSSITSIVPGDNITVDCTKDDCDRYEQKPDFLNESDTPPLT